MKRRTIFALVSLVPAVAGGLRLALRSTRASDRPGPTAPARGGWETCSAPSARWYDLAAGRLLAGLYRRMAGDLASELAAQAVQAPGHDDPRVLEIGPGPGHLAVELCRRLDGLRLDGVDIDPAMVARAAARATRERVADRATFVVGDVAALPFPEASFDLVTSSFSAHHWPDGVAAFAEIRRVLRPGGRAVVYDLPDRWGRFERSAPPLEAAAEAGGFPGAHAASFRWPGLFSVVQRLGVARLEGPPPVEA